MRGKAWVGAAVLVVAVLVWFATRDESDARRTQRDGATSSAGTERSAACGDETGATESQQSDADKLTIRFKIQNESGEPVADAHLAVDVQRGVNTRFTGRTGADGTGSVDVPRNDDDLWVQVSAWHARYQRSHTWYYLPSDSDVVLMLATGTPFAVVVLAPDRKPVAGANVTAKFVRKGGMAGFWTWSDEENLGAGVTDADGRAYVGAVPELPIIVGVDKQGLPLHTETVDVIGREPIEYIVNLVVGGVIEGTVRGPDGTPVASAVVKPRTKPRPTAKTDAQGNYRLEPIGTGPVDLVATAEGFGPGYFGAEIGWDDPVPIRVRPGEVVTGVDLMLGRASVVRGRVLDPDGKPVAAVSVGLYLGDGFTVQRWWTSDAEGRFALGPFSLATESGIAIYFWSAEFEIKGIEDGELKPGEDLDLGDIKAVRLGRISGVVVDETGARVGPGYFNVSPDPNMPTIIRRDGTFELTGLQAGSVSLVANLIEPSRRSRPRTIDVKTGAHVDGLEIVVHPTTKIAGRVITPDGKPRRVQLALIAEDGAPASRGWTQSAADGTFTFPGLLPGRYRVGLPDPETSGKFRDVPLSQLVDAGKTDVEFVVPIQGVILQGRVVAKRNGRPIKDARIGVLRYKFLLPVGTRYFENVDPEGNFTIELDEPGTMSVDAAADGFASFRTNKLELKKGEIRDLGTIRLGDAGVIAGQVVDAQGAPVPYTRINILDSKFQTNRHEPFTDQEGRFWLEDVSPGHYTVFAVSPRHPLGMVRGVNVKEAETTQVDIRFQQASPLVVVVRGVGNRPLGGASLSWTFPAIAPLTSKLARHKIPPGYGSHLSDAEGRIEQPYLPPGEVTIMLEAKGYRTVQRKLRLTPGEENRVSIRMRKD